MNLLELATALVASRHELDGHLHHAMERSCQTLQESAKTAIGTYRFGWPSLATSTLARKSGDTPLYETGALQASIQFNISGDGGSLDAYVGTNDPKAAWQEFGTSRGIPPRPFMGGALNEKGDEVRSYFAGTVRASLK